MTDDNNTRKPHNYFDEATPAQREEWAKRMQMEEEELAKIEAAAAEVKRIKEIGEAQKIFNIENLERFKFRPINGNDDGREQKQQSRFRLKSKSKPKPRHKRRPSVEQVAIARGIIKVIRLAPLDPLEIPTDSMEANH